ncbi:MAG TPA: hypothetical protein VD866_07790 [Urbifossiella sp.]|nr:hypothetical protein [Urbifossiella sp.]
MPVLTVLAPGTPVTVPKEKITAAVEWAVMRLGASPLVYGLAWQNSGRGPVYRRTVTADLVEEIELRPEQPDPPPRVTVIAPGSAATCPMDRMPNLRVESVEVRAARDADDPPTVKYRLTWNEPDGPTHRAAFWADQVGESPEDAGRTTVGMTRLAELGRLMADTTPDEG